MDESIEQARQAAAERLGEAWRRGYMEAGEHERRTTALRRAESIEQVEAIERGDLRDVDGGVHTGGGLSPIPPISPVEERPTGAAVAVPDPSGEVSQSSGRGLDPKIAGAIQGVVPLVAVALFFLTNDSMDQAWLWFLLIPIVWTVLPALTRGGSSDDDSADE